MFLIAMSQQLSNEYHIRTTLILEDLCIILKLPFLKESIEKNQITFQQNTCSSKQRKHPLKIP